MPNPYTVSVGNATRFPAIRDSAASFSADAVQLEIMVMVANCCTIYPGVDIAPVLFISFVLLKSTDTLTLPLSPHRLVA